MAPCIPGLNDHEMLNIFTAAANAGARDAGITPLRLPGAVAGIFAQWLDTHAPDKKEKILNRVREMRGGKLNDPRFGAPDARRRLLRRANGRHVQGSLESRRLRQAAPHRAFRRQLPRPEGAVAALLRVVLLFPFLPIPPMGIMGRIGGMGRIGPPRPRAQFASRVNMVWITIADRSLAHRSPSARTPCRPPAPPEAEGLARLSPLLLVAAGGDRLPAHLPLRRPPGACVRGVALWLSPFHREDRWERHRSRSGSTMSG